MTTRPFSRILMAVDGSFNAEATARYAVRFAHASGASLHVLTVISPRATGAEKDAAMASVERIVREGRASQIETTGLIREGRACPQIAAVVQEERIDLAMAAARRRHARENRYFIRTVSRWMMAELPCSVLAVRVVDPGRLAHPRKMLVSLGPDEALAAHLAPVVSMLARAAHVSAEILTIFEKSSGFLREAAPTVFRRHESRAGEIAAPIRTALLGEGREAEEHFSVVPSACRETMARAVELHAEAILTAVTRREASRRMLRSHPLEILFRETPCDLLVFRPG